MNKSTKQKSFLKRYLGSAKATLLLVSLVFGAMRVQAQLAVSVTNPSNATPALAASYTTLADAVTALSGSGPAYFFYIVKQMVEAGKQMGFDQHTSEMLVKQTMLGSYHLLNNSEKNLDELIKAVASKGGTTEAALKCFEEGLLSQNLKEGIFAAQKRATELSK